MWMERLILVSSTLKYLAWFFFSLNLWVENLLFIPQSVFVFSRSVYQAPGILIKSIFKSQWNEIKIWPTIWLHWNNRHVFYHLLNVTICNSIIEVSLLYRELHTCNVDNSMSLYTDACDTIATIRVTDTSNTSQSFLVSLWFSFVVRTLPVRCTFVRNADVHTTILLTRGVCCTQDLWDVFIQRNWSSAPSERPLLKPAAPRRGQPLLDSLLLWVTLLESTYKGDRAVAVLLLSAYFTGHNVFQQRSCCHIWQEFLLFWGWIEFKMCNPCECVCTHTCWSCASLLWELSSPSAGSVCRHQALLPTGVLLSPKGGWDRAREGERRWEPRYCFASALQEAMPSAALSPAQSQRLTLRSSTQTPSGGSCLERLPNPSGAFQLSQSIGKQLPTCNSPLQLAGVGPVFLTGSWMTYSVLWIAILIHVTLQSCSATGGNSY